MSCITLDKLRIEMTGILLNALDNALEFPVAFVTGVTLGWIISYAFHKLKKSSVSSKTTLGQNVGQEGKVLISIEKGKMGKIRIKQSGQLIDIPAKTNDDDRIEEGQKILIIKIKDGVATVSQLEQFLERLQQKRSQSPQEQ